MRANKSVLNTLLDSRFGLGQVYVTPVRMENVEHRYKGWHQDWFESEVPEWMKLVAGYDENVDGEVPIPVIAKFKVNYADNCVELAENICWNNLPMGTYHKIRGRNRSATLLWESSLWEPVAVCSNDSLTITSVKMQLL